MIFYIFFFYILVVNTVSATAEKTPHLSSRNIKSINGSGDGVSTQCGAAGGAILPGTYACLLCLANYDLVHSEVYNRTTVN